MSDGITMTNAVIDCILSRSATKYFDPAASLSDDQIRELVRIGTTAPTSFHLQNWRFIAVRTPEAKARLRPIASITERSSPGASASPEAQGHDTACHRPALFSSWRCRLWWGSPPATGVHSASGTVMPGACAACASAADYRIPGRTPVGHCWPATCRVTIGPLI